MLRNDRDAYGWAAILFHWTIAILFLGLLALGYVMPRVGDPTLQFVLYQWHKSFGFLILALSAARLLWALSGVRPHAPESLSRFEKFAARLTHVTLYALLILVPLSGWAVVSSSPLRIPSFAFNLVVIPHLPLEVSREMEDLWSATHAVLSYLAAIVALAHTIAALRHHFWLRDETLMRMLLPGSQSGSEKQGGRHDRREMRS